MACKNSESLCSVMLMRCRLIAKSRINCRGQDRWGLTMREQVPVPESKFRSLVGTSWLQEKRLIDPRSIMAGVERRIAVSQGHIPISAENLVASCRPGEPNHLRLTQSAKSRNASRSSFPRYSDEQQTAISRYHDQLIVESRAYTPPRMHKRCHSCHLASAPGKEVFYNPNDWQCSAIKEYQVKYKHHWERPLGPQNAHLSLPPQELRRKTPILSGHDKELPPPHYLTIF
eukprot:TRINITY_DN111481_c0_g1_i1.p1 TRINITY_DN111481_c0_g1~~TRINITY_DN111481_c0_g1_i1.p1  ORF type:complete len:230 (-),score=20.03 TRINITY_DN111481_c0_g1_i1:30-719(-)